MKFLKRLLSTDPETLLEKAEQALGSDTPVPALDFLGRLPDDLSEDLRARRDLLAGRAHDAVAQAASERALAFEEAGMLEQAGDSLTLALEHCRDGETRHGIEERLARLRFPEQDDEPESEATEDVGEVGDIETSYLTLVSMLKEEVAERYDDRSEAFRRAYVDLNAGSAAESLPFFDNLVREAPEDPVGRLERGRCLLLLDRAEEAQHDFEVAWSVFGDDPLDAPGALSLPLLWAETAMELEQHDRVVEKLAAPAAPDRRQPALSHLLAMARIELRQFDEAAVLLKKCIKAFPGEPAFPHLMAQVQVTLDDHGAAIETLEKAIAPACAGGGCRKPALHLPSARMLASLHLGQGSDTNDARGILELIQGSLRGRLEWEDLALLARCERQDGDESACARLLQQARALAPPSSKEIHAQLDALAAAKG